MSPPSRSSAPESRRETAQHDRALSAARPCGSRGTGVHDAPAEHFREGREVDDVLPRVLPGLSGTGPVARSDGLSGIAVYAVPGEVQTGWRNSGSVGLPEVK